MNRILKQSLILGTLLLCCAPLFSLSAQRQPVKPKIQYNRDVRPILSANCFLCHGADSGARKAGLRLDRAEYAYAVRNGKSIIARGKPQNSELIKRINGVGGIMPPASHKKLTPKEAAILTQWVAEGAHYEAHWSFAPLPQSVAVPKVKNMAWCRSEIDRFVLAKLEPLGISPSRPATPADWLRRVSFDLTGLPPTVAEADAFLKDKASNAYEKVVDRLLASPHYGEQMAVPWLDVGRYADSYGYQSDLLCPTYPYRDWVIKAFNDNLSYDKFVTYQVAGDLLPNATRETRLATAFNRLHRMTNEGGSVSEEWRMEGIADRVRTFGTAFLGLTVECARCHDHKYDPITQKDFYSLSSFFNNVDEYGMYDRADIVPSPTLLLPTPEQDKEYKQALEAVSAKEQRFTQTRTEREKAFQEWLVKRQAPSTPDMTGRFDFEKFEGGQLKNLVEKDNGAKSDEVPLVPGRVGNAAQLDGENNVNFPALGRFTRHTPFTISFWMKDPRKVPGYCVVFQACDGTDAGPHGYDLLVDDGKLTARLFRHWPGNAIAVSAKTEVPKDTWTYVTVTYDGSSRAKGLRIYVNGRLGEQEIVRDNRMVKGNGQHTLVFGQKFRDKGFKGGLIDDLSIFSRDISPLEVAQLCDGRSLSEALANPQAHTAELKEYFLSAIDSDTRKSAQELANARAKQIQVEDGQYEIAVMEEMPQVRPTFVLARGRYDAPKTDANRVDRHLPASVLPFPANMRRDRLGVAQWLTLPNHPLTARVAVNRLWAFLFGRGIVETTEDFGVQGSLPTHPELLDWLSRDFIQSGWNVKGLLKKIVLSSVYRQASALRPDLKARDPQNLLLARGAAHRLKAEEIRDVCLATSGLLDARIGGAPVSPYQPGDLWRESNSFSPAYVQGKGSDLYRRSLYTVWKRTAPMPNMIAFDAGSREVCIGRRQATNTPLQALVLLNDPQFVEAARVIGERILKEGGATLGEQVRFAFRLLATREPSAQERALLEKMCDEQRNYFAENPEEAKKLLAIGERKADATLAPVDCAVAAVLAQTILNLDATIWKR